MLCDAIAYAAKQKVDTIVDIATLTGACMVALGKYKAGLMGNNGELIEKLKTAAAQHAAEATGPSDRSCAAGSIEQSIAQN